MAIVYDEVWITSSREVKICLDAIKAYEKQLKELEEIHGINKNELLLKIDNTGTPKNPLIFWGPCGNVPSEHEARWYETYLALLRTRDRLEELKRFLE